MSIWLVSNIPWWLLLLGLIVLVAGGAVLAQTVVHHSFPWLKEKIDNDATEFAVGVVRIAYPFIIGFVVSAMWGQINNVDARMRTEGSTGVLLARTLTVFDTVDSDRIRQSLLEYARAARAEWPLAARGHSSDEAENALDRLYAAYNQVQPRNDIQKTFLASSLDSLNTISRARTERLLQARTDTGPPWSLWAVIFLTSGLVLGYAITCGAEKSTKSYLAVTTVGMLVAANLFLVLQFAHPFVGDVATSPEPLREVIQVLSGPTG